MNHSDCPARLRFLGYYSTEEKASTAFDTAYLQRTAFINNNVNTNTSSNLSLYCPSLAVKNNNNYNYNVGFNSNNSYYINKNVLEGDKDDVGECMYGVTIAIGAQTVSDALMQLRCKAMRKELDNENIGLEIEVDGRVIEGKEQGVEDRHTLTKFDMMRDNEDNLKENALILEILKEKMPAPTPDCHDTYSTSLDAVMSVLSTDNLISSISVMGLPQIKAYQREREKEFETDNGERSVNGDVDDSKEVKDRRGNRFFFSIFS